MRDILRPFNLPSPAGADTMSRVRWNILGLVTLFGLVSYFERLNLSVAARFIRDEFRLTDVQIGWSFSAFLIGYTAMQVPAGILTDRLGARRVLGTAAWMWFLLTLILAITVGHITSTAAAVLTALIAIRLLLGLAEAPTFPGASLVVSRWFPPQARGLPNAIIQSASYLGGAVTIATLAGLTTIWGWRAALFTSAAPALALAVVWSHYATDYPGQHRGVSASELNLIAGNRHLSDNVSCPLSESSWRTIRQRNVVLLSLSYFGQGYVVYLFFFWFFVYLVDVRGFAIAAAGVVAAIPTGAAALCALIGGSLSDRAARVFGPLVGRRWIILSAGILGAAALVLGTTGVAAPVAIAGFAVAIGTRGLVESAYWSIAIDLARGRTASVGGAMNMMANLGGAVSTALAPVLVIHFGWTGSILVAAVLTALTGFILFGMSSDQAPLKVQS